MTERQGLYDPAYEHDACGIGFVAHIHGVRSRDVVEKSLEVLHNLTHRSAIAADGCTGDGAGILLQVPHAFLRRVCGPIGISLPDAGSDCYLASFSSRTMVYKGMLRPDQLAQFYADLSEPDLVSAIALVHSRFSTNTFPSWRLAHPYRFLCHNGEINTLRGNLSWMRVREGIMSSSRFGGRLAALLPVCRENQSDSASLDNALELLTLAGRPLGHAMAMLIPEAWEGHATMPDDRRAFYEYHASLMEPWDGPAAVAFTDGRQIAAMLDRNGLRPARYVVTADDFVVLASEAGALAIPVENIRAKGRLEPGKMLVVNTTQGRILDDEAIKMELAAVRPYRRWVTEQRVDLTSLIARLEGNELQLRDELGGRDEVLGARFEAEAQRDDFVPLEVRQRV